MAGLSWSFTAHSAEQETADGTSSWGLGLGVASSQQPYTDIDRDNEAIPLIYFENDYVRVFGPSAEFKLPSLRISDTQQLNFNIVAEYDSSGYEEGDARILDGMDDRDGGFWAGAKVEWQNELVNVNAEWLADVSGDSDGQRFTLGLERTWTFGEHMMLTPRLAAIWQDQEYVDYYFGVRSDEVRFDRAAYKGKSTINTEFGVRGTYLFDQQHSVFLDLEAVRLGSEIEDSPLVDSSSENSVRFGYLYRF
ncbi:MipA/OmpV family protein [Pseudomonas sp. EA_35y_Pfl2_R111]|uniref:MipA/OmpV family protein n=1 Tax=Pseudomonas sp. EA_35y_Pfl2_R111 TaxID=3088689 RepID=UPI00403F8007